MPFLKEQYEFARAIANENVEDFHGEQAHIFTNPALNECISQVIQNTRKDWLRSEIERLDEREEELCAEIRRCELAHEDCEHTRTRIYEVRKIRDDIITRYKEELKVLENK